VHSVRNSGRSLDQPKNAENDCRGSCIADLVAVSWHSLRKLFAEQSLESKPIEAHDPDHHDSYLT
jgi:hypothetical protein